MPDSNPITGKTRIFGIFGDPVSHSLSPLMHNAAFDALSLPCRYLPFNVSTEGLERAARGILPLGIKGINVTIPHKEAIIPFLDQLSLGAQKSGAVNTIEVSAGALIGHNTDGSGFVASLLDSGVDPPGKNVILLGAGGAARGVAVGLLENGVRNITLINRHLKRAEALAEQLISITPDLKIRLLESDFKGGFPQIEPPVLLINATPLGMQKSDSLPFPEAFIDPLWTVADLIYRPFETPFLIAARKRGAKVIPGIGMLLHQGALSFEIWTKMKAPIEAMRAALALAVESLNPNKFTKTSPRKE